MLHEDTTMNTFKHLVSEIDFVLEEPYVVLHVIGRFPHHIWGNRTCSDWPSWSSHILLACSRRSDSEERCEVKGARKNKAREGERCSPAPLYFSSLSLLRTALHYLNAWNRLIYYLLNRIILIYICILHIYLRMRLFIVCWLIIVYGQPLWI